jgi:hypothetical protein
MLVRSTTTSGNKHPRHQLLLSSDATMIPSGIHPGYSCKEGRRRTPTRIPL